ncbi:peptidase [Streptomyces sp. AS58]|nr:peptidase [Streptomyces sp. AS58]
MTRKTLPLESEDMGSRRTRAGAPLGALAMTVLLASTQLPGTAWATVPVEASDAVPARFSATVRDQVKTVTLITGDKVTAAVDGSVTGIERAKGREKAAFSVREIDGHHHVIPVDALPAVARGTLDRRLFDITQLLADGYDDATRADLPLIVTGPRGSLPDTGALRGAGARVSRELHSVAGVAVEADKEDGATFWDKVTEGADGGQGTARLTEATGVTRIWLDGKRRASLDRSVPQIGAPTAWEAGFDGEGVTVAVLDTGVDQTRPDLVGQEIAERNFTESADNADRYGHGTHVASTVAGTGAASGRGFKGVAPGARILDAKVLSDEGSGSDSGVIAGMEWAVAEGARIVNLSLGGTDTPGVDPLEQAVNRLSTDTNTLFVIAAGNDGGAGESTIGSPGSAESALTVGAVDKQDVLADFSSRGPRVGDSGVKPDLTAPGVGITAAVPPGSVLDTDDPSAEPGYESLDGTSMATPHVAGAAALLAQQHPDWSGRRIKAALTGSAEPGPYSAYQQGTGRTDLSRAIEQTVVTEGGPLSFGVQRWPHHDDEPVTKEVVYRNLGTRPVVLDLATEAVRSDGTPAPEGLFTVSPSRLTVPAGGEAKADVTADTRVTDATGSYGGAVTAVQADSAVSVRTAIGVEHEQESYDLTVRHIGDDGKPAGNGATMIEGRDSDLFATVSDAEDGEVTVRLPKGGYALTGFVGGEDVSPDPLSIVMAPAFELTEDTTVVVDARKAQHTRITVPDTEAVNHHAQLVVGYTVSGRSRPSVSLYNFTDFSGFKTGHLGPVAPENEAYAQYSGFWTRPAGSAPAGGTDVNYRLAWNRTGTLGAFTTSVQTKQLAKIDWTAGSPTAGATAQIAMAPEPPLDGPAADFSTPREHPLPRRTTEYVLANGVRWLTSVHTDGVSLLGDYAVYRPGRTYTERYNVGVFGPALPARPTDVEPGWNNAGAARRGNEIKVELPLFSDGQGHLAYRWGGPETTLHVDGQELTGSPTSFYGGVSYEVPAHDGRYDLVMEDTRDPQQHPVSTHVRAHWTFRSQHTPDNEWTRLPLSVVRFTPELSASATAKAGERFQVPFTVEGAATAQTIRKLAFEVSYDDGSTWAPAEAVNGTHLSLVHPERPGSVSLRAKLTDSDGNTLTQTIDRAYHTVE